MKKIFYRVCNTETNQGLWYDYDGNFTGLIHDEFDFCTNSELPMPFDESVVGWLSTTDKLNDLWFWFTKEDIAQLEEHGYYITIFETEDYREYENHWVILQETSKVIAKLPLKVLEEVYNTVPITIEGNYIKAEVKDGRVMINNNFKDINDRIDYYSGGDEGKSLNESIIDSAIVDELKSIKRLLKGDE